jgi:hypothetical protein
MDIKLDEQTHDILIENGQFSLTQNESESLAQKLKIKLTTFREEWFLDVTEGIPYYQLIFGKGTSKATIDAIFLRAISEEADVQQVLDFQSVVDATNRIYTLTFQVRSSNASEPIPVEITL